MLVVPLTNKNNWKNPPIVTIAIILINLFIFLGFQNDDPVNYENARAYYFESGLSEIELPRYREYEKQKNTPLVFNKRLKPSERKMVVFSTLEQDFKFLEKLRRHEIIKETDAVFSAWKEKRTAYDNMKNQVISYRFGFKPAYFEPITILTSMFLHGSMGHVIGNMVFLWIVGCILEAGCGRKQYILAYLFTGACAVLFFKLIYFYNTVPLIGASGAIAGLMGMLAILYGKKTIKIFYSLGFFFDTIRIKAIYLFPLWVGNEVVQLFWGGASNVAYVAHIGGLLSGAACAFVLLKIPDAVDVDIFEGQKKDLAAPLIEQALQKIAQLDNPGAISILNQALEKDPDNHVALTHLFNIHKQAPGADEFHHAAARLMTVLLSRPDTRQLIPDVFDEYKKRVSAINLSKKLLMRLCFALCDLEKPGPAGQLAMGLFKADKGQPGLPALFWKLYLAFQESGNQQNCQKIKVLIKTHYPHSQQAGFFSELNETVPV